MLFTPGVKGCTGLEKRSIARDIHWLRQTKVTYSMTHDFSSTCLPDWGHSFDVFMLYRLELKPSALELQGLCHVSANMMCVINVDASQHLTFYLASCSILS